MKIKSKYFENSVSGIFFSKSQDSLSFPEHFCEILAKLHQNFAEKSQNSSKKANEKWNFIFIPAKNWTVFRWNFEIWAVQKYENLVDLEKCCKNDYLVAIVAVHTAENEPFNFFNFSSLQRFDFDRAVASPRWTRRRSRRRRQRTPSRRRGRTCRAPSTFLRGEHR